MRTTSTKSIFEGIARLFGKTALGTEDLIFVADALDTDHLTTAWSFANWKELDVIEKRYFAADYAGGTTYALDDLVYYPTEDKYYTALGATTGNLPTDTNYWAEATDYQRYVQFVQTGKTSIGQVASVTKHDPRVKAYPGDVGFLRREDAIQIINPEQSYVYVRFTRREPRITSTAYNAGTTYAAGDVVYDATTGECYVAAQATTGDAVTDTTYWTLQEVPFFLRKYLIRAGLSSLYESKDKEDRADKNEAKALDALSAAYHVQAGKEGQFSTAGYRPEPITNTSTTT